MEQDKVNSPNIWLWTLNYAHAHHVDVQHVHVTILISTVYMSMSSMSMSTMPMSTRPMTTMSWDSFCILGGKKKMDHCWPQPTTDNRVTIEQFPISKLLPKEKRSPPEKWSSPGWPPARQAPPGLGRHRHRGRQSPWKAAPSSLPSQNHFSPKLEQIALHLLRLIFQATMSLAKNVFLMSLSSFFILFLSPALVLISASLSKLSLDWLPPIAQKKSHNVKAETNLRESISAFCPNRILTSKNIPFKKFPNLRTHPPTP